jgi:hypothetical protein
MATVTGTSRWRRDQGETVRRLGRGEAPAFVVTPEV